jgi:outer membrane protein W
VNASIPQIDSDNQANFNPNIAQQRNEQIEIVTWVYTIAVGYRF